MAEQNNVNITITATDQASPAVQRLRDHLVTMEQEFAKVRREAEAESKALTDTKLTAEAAEKAFAAYSTRSAFVANTLQALRQVVTEGDAVFKRLGVTITENGQALDRFGNVLQGPVAQHLGGLNQTLQENRQRLEAAKDATQGAGQATQGWAAALAQALRPLEQNLASLGQMGQSMRALSQPVQQAIQESATLGTGWGAMAGGAGLVTAAVLGLGTATIALTKQYTDNRLALRDMHLETGMTLPQLQALTDQARRGNIEFENLGTMLIRFNANIAQALRDPGSQAGQVLFGQLRLTREQLADPFTALLNVAQRIQGLASSDQGLAIRAVFGRNPTEIFRLFNQLLGENFPVLMQRVEELERKGPGAFEKATASAQQFQNRIAELETSIAEKWRAIMATFALPFANTLLDQLGKLGEILRTDIEDAQRLWNILKSLGKVSGPPGLAPAPTEAPLGPPPPPSTFQPMIEAAARERGIDPTLMARLALGESSFDPNAVSPRGARGLFQIMPRTAERMGVGPQQLFDPETSAHLAAQILEELHETFKGMADEWKLVIAAYNAGGPAIQALLRALPAGTPPSYSAIAPRLAPETTRLVNVVFPPGGQQASPYTEATQADTAATQANTKAKEDNATRSAEDLAILEKERDLYKQEATQLELLVIQRKAEVIARQQDSIEAEKFLRSETQALRERQLFESVRLGQPGRLPVDPGAQRDIFQGRVQSLTQEATALAETLEALEARQGVIRAGVRDEAKQEEDALHAAQRVAELRLKVIADEREAETAAADALARHKEGAIAQEGAYLERLRHTTDELRIQLEAINALRANPNADVQLLRLQRGQGLVASEEGQDRARGYLTTIQQRQNEIRQAQEQVQLYRRVGNEIQGLFDSVWSNIFDAALNKGQNFGQALLQSLQRFFQQISMTFMNAMLNALTGASSQTGEWAAKLASGLVSALLPAADAPVAGSAAAPGQAFYLGHGGLVSHIAGWAGPVPSYAAGTMVRGPHVAVIGDDPGGYGEAVIPLDGNRSVPVTMRGGQTPQAGGDIHIYMAQDFTGAIDPRALFVQHNQVIPMVVRNVQTDGPMRRVIMHTPRG